MDDIKKIKKVYGENFSHLCRTLFPRLLEQEGLLFDVISKRFAPTHSLYDDIKKQNKEDDFKSYIFSFVDVEEEEKEIIESKPPEELMDEAGYILHPECKTEDEIQAFKKYYAIDEELCTFKGGRLKSNRVWFAVKKNVDKIRRKDFKFPQKQDEYGTSVISIQFSRGSICTVSIKNRYNHSVKNPDATFSNNLDNIIPGLTQAFEDFYDIHLYDSGKPTFSLENYVMANDGKFYRYNYEINAIYYCENNVIVDHGEIKSFNKSRYEILDYFVLDKIEKQLFLYNNYMLDGFDRTFERIKNIDIRLSKDGIRTIFVTQAEKEVVKIGLNRHNQIISYEDPNTQIVRDFFLSHNKTLQKIHLPQAQIIGDNFLSHDNALQEINLPNATRIEDNFLFSNKSLQKISLPNVQKIGTNFLYSNETLQEVCLPKALWIEDHFLYSNNSLQKISLPNVQTISSHFLYSNEILQEISLPHLQRIGLNALCKNGSLQRLNVPRQTGKELPDYLKNIWEKTMREKNKQGTELAK